MSFIKNNTWLRLLVNALGYRKPVEKSIFYHFIKNFSGGYASVLVRNPFYG